MFNPEKFSSQEEVREEDTEKSPEKKEPKLTYDDFLYLSRESIGLRHVLGRDKAEEERTQGIEFGDAIAVSSFANLIRPDEMKEIKNSMKDRLPAALLENESTLKGLIGKGFVATPESLRDGLITRFGEVVKDFIDDSLTRDLLNQQEGLKLGETVDSMIDKIVKSETHFLIGKFNGANAAQAESGYPVGKCGSQNVSPENIYDFFTIERTDFNNLALDKDSPIERKKGDEVFSYTSQALYDKFLDKIHELREKRK